MDDATSPKRDHKPGQPAPPAQPDRPQQLQAPWRLSYLEHLSKQKGRPAGGVGKAAAGGKPGDGGGQSSPSFLGDYWRHPENDEANNVIVRTGDATTARGGLILLNRFPYANGHLLVALGRPCLRLLDYSEEQRRELWSLVDLAMHLCEQALQPQGINVGINQGAAAGAGVPEHLHVHVVPRWGGDVNFMSVVGNVRVIPGALEEMARRYRGVWEEVRGEGD